MCLKEGVTCKLFLAIAELEKLRERNDRSRTVRVKCNLRERNIVRLQILLVSLTLMHLIVNITLPMNTNKFLNISISEKFIRKSLEKMLSGGSFPAK